MKINPFNKNRFNGLAHTNMLKRVSIQNFKSLKDVTLDLQKVNLLIGPNNSGKTNFLKALEFYGEFAQKNALVNSNLIFQKDQDKSLSIHITFEGHSRKWVSPKTKYTHLTLEANNRASYSQFVSGSDDFTPNNHDVQSVDARVWQDLTGTPLIYKIDPNKLDKPGLVGLGAQIVSADASNLIAFFDYIRDEKPHAFAQIRADLNKCVSEFTEINFQSVEPTEELLKIYGAGTYKRIGLTDGKQGVIYWADELSEGTLYFIALLCIINQPNPPKILLLEEPEKGIHPRRIHEVMNFIFRLADDKDIQVIMTTHSPIVLDMFDDMPESVFIFEKDDDEGATNVQNLQKIIEESDRISESKGMPRIKFLDSLGLHWVTGFIGGVPK